MVDGVTVLVLVLLALGVVGSVVPYLPAGLLSLAGVVVESLYGAGRLHVLLFASFVVAALLAAVLEWFGPVVATRAGGASTRTAAYAGLAALLLFFVTGPVGIVLGIFGVIFWSELRAGRAAEDAWDNALRGTLGMLASTAAVLLLTLSVLLGYVVFVVWPAIGGLSLL